MKELARILPPADIEQLNDAENKPLVLCSLLSDTLKPLLQGGTDADAYIWEKAEKNIDDLVIVISQTEQLSSTPVPLSYRRHASRFLSVWTLTAPLFLVPQCGPILAIVSQFLMCWALYGSEEAGKIIEEPFGITREYGPNVQSQISEMGMLATENLPLLRYCQQIKRDIQGVESMWANLESTTPQCTLGMDVEEEDDGVQTEVMGGRMDLQRMNAGNTPYNMPLPILPIFVFEDSSDNYSGGR